MGEEHRWWFEFESYWLVLSQALRPLARGLWPQYLYLHNEDKHAHPWAVVTVNGLMYGSPPGCAKLMMSDRGLNSLVLASGV